MKACIAAGVLAVFSLAVNAQGVDRRIDANPNGELVVSNVAGSIRITGDAGREVHVTGELGANVERLDILAQGEDIIVRVVLHENGRQNRRYRFGDNETDLLIRAPRTMTIDVSAVSADIDVQDMRSEQRISSVSGDISTDAYGSEIRVESVSGDVDIDSRDAPVMARASSVSGDLSVRGPAGDVQAESVSGDVEIDATTVSRVDVRSVSGDLRLRAELGDDARVDATSTSGDIEFDWLGDGAGEYRLSTFSGEIYNCFGPSAPDTDDRPPGVELRFREGNSNARVEARTHSGDIEVCRR